MDEIGAALAEAVGQIDEYSSEERYSDPALAAWIESVRAAMEDLQLFLDGLPNADAEQLDDEDDLVALCADGPVLPTI